MNRPYSASVKIVDRKGQTLYLRRSPSAPSRAGEYEYPGGHIERGELPKEAALREVREEAGIRLREDELRLLSKEQGKRGIHYTYLARVGSAPRVKLSFEHDTHMWSTDQAAKANPNFISRYLAGADTSKMSTEQKAKEAAVGVGTTLALKQAGKTYAMRQAKKAAAKGIALKVAGTAGSKFVPVVGQAMMVVSAAPEVVAIGREDIAHAKESVRALKGAKGVRDVMSVGAKGTTRAVKRMFTVPARTASAAFFGSGTTKMAREAIGEKMKKAPVPAHENAGSFVPSSLRSMQTVARLTPQYIKAAEGTLMPALRASGKWIGATALATTGAALAIKGAQQQIGELKKPAAKNPSSIQANVAEINKLLKTMPSEWRAQLESNRAKLQVAGAQPHEAPPLAPNAHSVLLALNLNNRGDVSSEAAAGQEPASGNTVPEDVREAAMEGVRLSHKNNYGGYDFIGLARAIQLAISPKISDAALNRVRMYFDRKTKQDRLSDQYVQKHGKRYWSWMNWGGDPGARWSRSKRFAELVKENPVGNTKTDPTVPGILLHTAPLVSFMQRGSAFYPAYLYPTSKGQMLYPGDRPGYWKETPYIGASYEDAAKDALQAALYATGEVTVELVRLDLTRVPVSLDRLEQLSRNGRAERHAGDVPESVRKAMRTNPMRTGRENPYLVTRGGQAVPRARGEEQSTWEAAATHAERQEGEGTQYRLSGPDESGYYHIVDRKTGRPTGKYGTSRDSAQEVLKKLVRRTNPNLSAFIAGGRGLRVRDLVPPSPKPVATKKGKKAKKNPAQDLLEQALNQDSAAAYLPKDKELVRKMEAAGFVRILDENQARIRFAATSRARASRTPWQKFEPRKKSSEYPGQRNTPDERWTAEHAAEEQAYHSIHRAKRLPRSAKSNPSPGFTTESWLADVAGEEWANYDLNRAGIMHYSGSGIPTYRSLFRK